MTRRRFRGTVIHRRLPRSLICEQVAVEFEGVYQRLLTYRGDGLLRFPIRFSGICVAPRRPEEADRGSARTPLAAAGGLL
jgi:hypothetical protein